jgi:hypothetical protein
MADPTFTDAADEVGIPDGVLAALEGRPSVGSDEHALQLLTVREDGFVHVTLLSRAEVATHRGRVLLALAGRTTPANLARTGQATLVVIDGPRSTSLALVPVARAEHAGMTGFVTVPREVRVDSLGIPLRPIGFRVPDDLPGVERWDTSAQLLDRLASLVPDGPH